MEMEAEITTAVSPSINISNTYYCINSSSIGFDNATNETICGSDETSKTAWDIVGIVIVSLILGLMTLTTIVGNVFVIAAIILERNLQSVANYLILSLAVADLLVAVLVMPLGAIYEISQEWMFGATLCDMWTTCDLLCCTASILHLLAIATDRYWAVTQVNYIHQRTFRTIGTMILLIWLTSVIVSLAPLMGWKDKAFLSRINEGACMISQDVAYQVFATMSTFYVPLLVILILYAKIFMTARNRLRKRAAQKAKVTTFGVAARKCQKTVKDSKQTEANTAHLDEHPSQLPSNNLNHLNADGSNKDTLTGDHHHNSINSNHTTIPCNANSSVKGNIIYDTGTPSPQNCSVVLASTAATINPKSNQVHTVVVSNSCNSNSHSRTQTTLKSSQDINNSPKPATNGETTKNCNIFPENKEFHDTANCKSLLDCTEDNNALCSPGSVRITSSKSVIPVYNNHIDNGDKSPKKYINEEEIPLIQTSTTRNESEEKNESHQKIQCKKSETISGLYSDREGINIPRDGVPNTSSSLNFATIRKSIHDNSIQEFTSQENISKPAQITPSSSYNNTNQIKVYQNQACQTEGRSKRHVNFEHPKTDHGATQSPGKRVRAPIKLLRDSLTIRRQEKRRCKNERKAQQEECSAENGLVHKGKKDSCKEPKEKKHVSLEVKRERKAAKTLAIVTGAFIACWLPFFIMALIMPMLKDYQFNRHVVAFFLWMGYFNSTLNPMIYTIFSPEFRQAFQRILCGKSAAQNHRPRHLQ